jgi:hypothetical protein
MATFGQLIDETAAQLRSFTRDQELATWLTSSISDTAGEIYVNNAEILSRGRVEIDSELIILEDVDTTRKVGVIPPYGRGADGTIAASHSAQSKVTVAPLYPRKFIGDTLNQVILGVNGKLFGVEPLLKRAHVSSVMYELPVGTQRVLSVSLPSDPVMTKDRWYARDWTFDPQADTTTGKALYLYDYPPIGRDIVITVAKDLEALTDEADLFTDSGLPDSCRDVVMFGAVARLIASAGTYQMGSRAVGSQTTLGAQMDLPQSAAQMSRHFYQLHQQRLDEEVTFLLNRYNTRAHYSRGY